MERLGAGISILHLLAGFHRAYCDEYFGHSAEVNEHIKVIHGINTEQIKSQDIKLIFKNDE